MAEFTPTAEQSSALDAYRSGGTLVLNAGAGTGKTSTLRLLGESEPSHRKVLYLAFNKAIAAEAKRSFPRHVDAMTAHGLANRHLRASNSPRAMAVFSRLSEPLTPHSRVASMMGLNRAIDLGPGRLLQPHQQIGLARETVKRWCYTADVQITASHVPSITGLDDSQQAAAAATLADLANKVWLDAIHPRGKLRTTHDQYLKLFAHEVEPERWGYDAVYLDEAQDANPIMVHLMTNQIAAGVHTVIIGDSCQSIYSWRGATNAMSEFDAQHRVNLTTSFRFGQAVADEANRWLTLLDAPIRLTGAPNLRSRIVLDQHDPDALLCRTNATTVEQLLELHSTGKKVALVGDGKEVKHFAEAALQLRAGRAVTHPDLMAFTSWGAVQSYVEHDGGDELATMVKLVDSYGADVIVDAIDNAAAEAEADTVVSTAHKAKGREWARVKVADDFRFTSDPAEPPSREDLMLAYVTVTRAREELDRGSLDWIDQHTSSRPGHLTASQPRPQRDVATPAPPQVGNVTALPVKPQPPADPAPAAVVDPNSLALTLPPRVMAFLCSGGADPAAAAAAILTAAADDARTTALFA